MYNLLKLIMSFVFTGFVVLSLGCGGKSKKSSEPSIDPESSIDTNSYLFGYGQQNSTGRSFPLIWKNGVQVPLQHVDENANELLDYIVSSLDCFAADGKDFYLCGRVEYLEPSGVDPISSVAYWKNNKLMILPKVDVTGTANITQLNLFYYSPIQVVNSDVYLFFDYIYVDNSTTYTGYAKNGQVYLLPKQNTDASVVIEGAYSILPMVSGEDVYIYAIGYDNSDSFPIYWKNGELQKLSLNDGSTTVEDVSFFQKSIVKDGEENIHVYGTGSVEVGGNNVQVNLYWKNGELNILPNQIETSNVSFEYVYSYQQPAVAGGDAYLAAIGQSLSETYPLYYRNKELKALPVSNGSEQAIKVNNFSSESIRSYGSNFYIYARAEVESNSQPIYWKNGELKVPILNNGVDEFDSAYLLGSEDSVSLAGDDFYMFAEAINNDLGIQKFVLWKNEELNVLPMSNTEINLNSFNPAWENAIGAVKDNFYIYGVGDTDNGPVPVYWKNFELNELKAVDDSSVSYDNITPVSSFTGK